MRCTIVIPTRNRAPILAVTLDSLAMQSDEGFEVIVVCDGEDPQTRALSKTYSASYPLDWIFTAENHGQASARNTGAGVAKGELLLFLDDDTSAREDLILRHRRHHEPPGTSDALVVYGSLVYSYLREPHSHTEHLMRLERERTEAEIEKRLTCPGFQSIELDHRYRGIGVNCSITRTAFLRFGGFDAALKHRSEDFELGSRLYDAGAEFIFEPHAVAYHRETKDLPANFRWVCEMTGRTDVYRASKKGQRNAQTRGLTPVQHRSPWRRLKLSWYWDRPKTIRRIAGMCRKMTDTTGFGLTYQVWRRAELAAGYWQGVKSEGLRLPELRQLVGEPLPVLSFPSVSIPDDRTESKAVLSPQKFLRMMRALEVLKYRAVSPSAALCPGSAGRRVVLTFDGYEDFWFEVFPHIGRLGLRPLVFLAAERLGGCSCRNEQTGALARKFLSVEQVREMHGQGVEFGSCGCTQVWLPGLPDAPLCREITQSKARLEDLLGSGVECFAYPGGGVDARVRAVVARAGYKFAFSARQGLNFWEDPLSLRRIGITERDTSISLGLKLVTGRAFGQDTLPG